MSDIVSALKDHDFEQLFVECLHWNRPLSDERIEIQDTLIEVRPIAYQKNFTVFLFRTHRTVLAHELLLDLIERQLSKTHPHHILIHYCEAPRKQVWQWATSKRNGTQILHRDAPFLSETPPPRLLKRIEGLKATDRIGGAFRRPNFFPRILSALLPDSIPKPIPYLSKFSEQNARLGLAIQRGEPGALATLVESNLALVKYQARWLARCMKLDIDEAEQTAVIGLIQAARRFDPERGHQFSTYAHIWIRRACQRYSGFWEQLVHVPVNVLWSCYFLQKRLAKFAKRNGRIPAESRFSKELAASHVLEDQWQGFISTRHMESLSDIRPEDSSRFIIDMSEEQDSVLDIKRIVTEGLRTLTTRQARIVSLRHGIIGDRAHTLEEIAGMYEITRERVRQIQKIAEEKLKKVIVWDQIPPERFLIWKPVGGCMVTFHLTKVLTPEQGVLAATEQACSVESTHLDLLKNRVESGEPWHFFNLSELEAGVSKSKGS